MQFIVSMKWWMPVPPTPIAASSLITVQMMLLFIVEIIKLRKVQHLFVYLIAKPSIILLFKDT